MSHGPDKPAGNPAIVELSFEELCSVCGLERRVLIEWVAEGIVTPRRRQRPRWIFGGRQVRRARIASRLQRDLGLETASLPLVMDLLEEVQSLRTRLRILDRHLTSD